MSAAAHDVVRSFDCVWPGCPREARREGGYCDQGHVGPPPAGARGRVEPGSLAHLDDDPQPEPEPEPVKEHSMRCKTPGCTNERLGAKGGMYAGLCAPHKREKMQTRLAAAKPDAAAKPPPVAAPAPPAAPANGTLAELGRRVDERIARIQALTLEITAERDLLADDVNTFHARVRQAQQQEPTTP